MVRPWFAVEKAVTSRTLCGASVADANHPNRALEQPGVVLDREWEPTLLRSWDYQLNASGKFAKAAMHGEIK
jgi:hypothetical protein